MPNTVTWRSALAWFCLALCLGFGWATGNAVGNFITINLLGNL